MNVLESFHQLESERRKELPGPAETSEQKAVLTIQGAFAAAEKRRILKKTNNL